MMQVIYELGCRVGEFVRIQLKHIDFGRSSVYLPPENTKTGHRRTSHLPRGLVNEIKSLLKSQGKMGKRDDLLKKPDEFLFYPPGRPFDHYSENRLRQIFQKYISRDRREVGGRAPGTANEFNLDAQFELGAVRVGRRRVE